MALPTLEVEAGSAAAWSLTIHAEGTGLPVEGYDGTEALSADVWPGDDLPALFHPAVTWVDAAAAKIRIALAPSSTASLAGGRYQLRARVTPAGDGLPRALFRAWLDVRSTPGTGTARPVYGTADEMLRLAPWLTSLQAETDQSNFAEARADAREWLDGIILERWAGLYPGRSFARQDTFDWSTPGATVAPAWMRAALAADGLLVRPAVARACACYAIAEACEPQLGKLEGTSYQALGRRMRYQAEQLVRTLRAEVDTNADGLAEYAIDLGGFRIR
jgi:hypothetical protein